MSFVCGQCGEVHEAASRYFMWRRPHLKKWDGHLLRFDDKFTCRIPGRRYFIFCELALPFSESEEDPLGFMVWAEVSLTTYEDYRKFRRFGPRRSLRRKMIIGRLANPVPAVEESLGTRVRFAALREDPTPYICWVAPQTSLAARVQLGATHSFWHDALDWLRTAP